MKAQDHRQQRLLRPRDVLELTGVSRSALYRMVQSGEFPQPLQIGERCRAFVAAEVDAWIQQRIAERDALPSARP